MKTKKMPPWTAGSVHIRGAGRGLFALRQSLSARRVRAAQPTTGQMRSARGQNELSVLLPRASPGNGDD
jgi:hypothetical protein